MTVKGVEIWRILHPKLLDKEWFISQRKAGKSYKQMAKEEGCGDKTIRKAAKLHGLLKPRPYIEVKNQKLKEALDKIPK